MEEKILKIIYRICTIIGTIYGVFMGISLYIYGMFFLLLEKIFRINGISYMIYGNGILLIIISLICIILSFAKNKLYGGIFLIIFGILSFFIALALTLVTTICFITAGILMIVEWKEHNKKYN